MFYTILRTRDTGERYTCSRCGRELSVAVRFLRDGETITAGRECARHYGIVWTPQYGPAAYDHETLMLALQAQETRRGQWVMAGSQRRAIRELVGSVAWEIAWAVASHLTLRIGRSDEAWRCYQAVWAAYQSLREAADQPQGDSL